MIIDFKDNSFDKQKRKRNLDDVINQVTSDEFKDISQKIRSNAESESRETKLRCLPVFFPGFISDDNLVSPTGIIQFDVDKNKNKELNFDHLAEEIRKIDAVLYAFRSPSGGLKFSLLSDFCNSMEETTDSVKYRYRSAYKLAEEYILGKLSVKNIVFDNCVKSIMQPCFLSWDPEAFFNPGCSRLNLNDKCVVEPSMPESYGEANEEFVQELLDFVPRHLSYEERLPVNFAVLNVLGGSIGTRLLLNHWDKTDKNKLLRQLKDQWKGTTFGNLGTLIRIAKKNGYKEKTGSNRKYIRAKPSEYKFSPLVSIDEGQAQLRTLIDAFFEKRKSMYINISAGSGKTETILEKLKTIKFPKKVLYLTRTQELAKEIKKNLSAKIRDRGMRGLGAHVRQILGKEKSCSNKTVLEQFKNANLPIPPKLCMTDCVYSESCDYIDQFDCFFNIRIMSQEEFIGQRSAFFHGVGADGKPREFGFNPEYIIIDEDWLSFDHQKESINTKYASLRNIINDCMNGEDLEVAIEKNQLRVISDCSQMQKDCTVPVDIKRPEHYINAMKELPKRSEILIKLVEYINTKDDQILGSMWVTDNKLHYSYLRTIADRYKNTPTIYLDATADENLIRRILGDIDVHTIQVHSSKEINVYQAENSTFTKDWLSDETNRDILVKGLTYIVSKYKKVGIITYKRLSKVECNSKNKEIRENFDRWLADQLGVKVYGHFGAIRGLNVFDDVDCLLVVGRHQISQYDAEEICRALFHCKEKCESVYANVPVRMKDGTSMSLNCKINIDERSRWINNHFSKAETIQAIGRGRLIYGTPKDIYLFSNERLESHVEITRFFRIREYFGENPWKPACDLLKKVGFVRNNANGLQSLNIKRSDIKDHRQLIESYFIESGFPIETIELQDRHRNKKSHQYFVYDREALLEHLGKGQDKVLSV